MSTSSADIALLARVYADEPLSDRARLVVADVLEHMQTKNQEPLEIGQPAPPPPSIAPEPPLRSGTSRGSSPTGWGGQGYPVERGPARSGQGWVKQRSGSRPGDHLPHWPFSALRVASVQLRTSGLAVRRVTWSIPPSNTL